PGLQKIEIPAQEDFVFTAIDFIRESYCGRQLPLQVKFVRQDTVLARVITRGQISQYAPVIDVVEWMIDHVSGPMQDRDVQVLDSASQAFPFALASFTLDITALTVQGLVSFQSILQRSILEHLHIR
ncbi:hypothetical protein BGZ59_003252, partial [Podila verticillata]